MCGWWPQAELSAMHECSASATNDSVMHQNAIVWTDGVTGSIVDVHIGVNKGAELDPIYLGSNPPFDFSLGSLV